MPLYTCKGSSMKLDCTMRTQASLIDFDNPPTFSGMSLTVLRKLSQLTIPSSFSLRQKIPESLKIIIPRKRRGKTRQRTIKAKSIGRRRGRRRKRGRRSEEEEE
ncbi:hypothetical protein PoB_007246400 [Plakobranchus ocellatus]|uniref:Uncharacterized protein n=1 Tax=Plakobranchus ocellatus TaxID=259542 RepID=A0AAV4DPL8_9GAST|nr:hypothetical protein PoB_007246400 [Plakobranchus ocellatus]